MWHLWRLFQVQSKWKMIGCALREEFLIDSMLSACEVVANRIRSSQKCTGQNTEATESFQNIKWVFVVTSGSCKLDTYVLRSLWWLCLTCSKYASLVTEQQRQTCDFDNIPTQKVDAVQINSRTESSRWILTFPSVVTWLGASKHPKYRNETKALIGRRWTINFFANLTVFPIYSAICFRASALYVVAIVDKITRGFTHSNLLNRVCDGTTSLRHHSLQRVQLRQHIILKRGRTGHGTI